MCTTIVVICVYIYMYCIHIQYQFEAACHGTTLGSHIGDQAPQVADAAQKYCYITEELV